MNSSDVVVIGGGLTGLAAALALAKTGLQVVVAEQEEYSVQLRSHFDGRVSAIALGSQRVLAHIGAWEHMCAQAEPIWDIRVSDGDSPFFLHYSHAEVGEEPFGWIVENRYIRQGLVEAVRQQGNIRIIAPARVESLALEAPRAEIGLSNGETVCARLVIGADGKRSRVRDLAGIGASGAAYGQTAIVCTIAHEQPHHGLAQERFLPAGPFAVLPMTSHRSSLVWVEKTEHAPAFLALSEAECVQEIRERVGDYLGELRLAGPRFSYPLSWLHTATYIAPRLALVGDAAHAIHPIAGQGVNLGWRDVAALAEVVEEHAQLGLDIGGADVLGRYQRWRRFDNTGMLAVTDGLTRLFGSALPPVKLARGLGLWGVGRLPGLKRFFMRDAMGLTGDVPRMMRAPSPACGLRQAA